MQRAKYCIGELCTLVKGTSPTMKTLPGQYPLVVTAEHRRSSDIYQLEGPAVCVPLISSTGHGHASLHRVHYQTGKFALANLLVALLPKDPNRCDAKYLYHLLMAKKDEYFVPLMQGTANVSLKEADIAGVEISLPPLDEQRRLVARIEELAERIAEAKGLRREAMADADKLLIGMAHRADLDADAKRQAGWREVTLGEVVSLASDPERVKPSENYPNLGIYSFARGLFAKAPIEGIATSATVLYRVHKGQFIYSRLFAFEGAYGVVDEEFDNHFVSNEYPTFECDKGNINADFLFAYFKAPSVWSEVAAGSKGLGDRRQRVQPSQVLAHCLWLPPIYWQVQIAQVRQKVNELRQIQANAMTELDALVPSVLDKAFGGEL